MTAEAARQEFTSAKGSLLKRNLLASADCESHIGCMRMGVQMRDAQPDNRNSEQQGNRTMTRNLAFAASIAMLITISGQALAETATSNAWHEPEAASPSARQAVYGVNVFDRTMATETGAPNPYQYHGGPKSND